MDNFKHTEMITYFYLKNLRELLEYATNKNKTKEDYDTKKKIFEQVISENGLITTIVIKNNPDQTDKIKELFEDFMFNVFNDRVISFEDNKMHFDVALKLNFFKSIHDVHELFNSVSLSQINFAHNKQQENYDKSIEELLNKEDVLYRTFFLSVLDFAVRETFLDFVNEMNSSKGQANPQTNFITNILGQYLQISFSIMDGNPRLDDALFLEAKHRFKTAIDAITGKLGKKTLKDQEDYFILATEAIDKCLVVAEAEWVKVFNPLLKETIEFEQNLKK
ncbi:MAG: hypothetical protein MR766_05370 [Erysipelotrichaceae bacterium]|nr:hypothetical protein [Erysipelotrichaceae bacterium]